MKTICFACLAVVLSLPLTGLATPGDPSAEGNNDQPGPEVKTPEATPKRAVKNRSAVSALAWIASKQSSDGNWRFDPPSDSAHGYANSGTWKSDSAATALALRSMLGASQTHERKGPYQKTVADGLNWLVKRQAAEGDLSAGGERKLLSHAWAAIALAEAYALSDDKALRKPTQAAVDFIVAAQDQKTGGWTNDAKQSPGTILSAQLVDALNTAKFLAGAKVPQATLDKASAFLDSVQSDNGAKYGETSPRDGTDASTAAGLLARQYLGWNRENPAMAKGLDYLTEIGPSTKDCALNYHGMQFLYNFHGPAFDAWSRKLRRQLIDMQVNEGNEAGSWWNPDDVHAAEGGRLFQTTTNCLILKLYGRIRLFWRVNAREE